MDTLPITNEAAVEMIGLFGALVTTLIYVHLARRAHEAGGVSRASFGLAACVLAWAVGGIAVGLLRLIPDPSPAQIRALLLTNMVEKTGALTWMIPLLALWQSDFKRPGMLRLIRGLQIGVGVTAAVFAVLHLQEALQPNPRPYLPLNSSFFRNAVGILAIPLLLVGMAIQRRRALPPVTRLSLCLTLGGVLGLTVAMLLPDARVTVSWRSHLYEAATAWFPLLIISGLIILFARFRFADRFIRGSLRIVAATTVGIAMAVAIPYSGVHLWLAPNADTADVALIAIGLGVIFLLLAFTKLNNYMNHLVDRHIFPAPDYDRLIAELQERLNRISDETQLMETTADLVHGSLELERAEIISIRRDALSGLSTSLVCGVPVIVDHQLQTIPPFPGVEVLVPLRLTVDAVDVLATAPGIKRNGLVTHEIAFLRAVATQLIGRMQSLRHERVLMENQSREARLIQQITEAELRALRAQINPHFLFNSLNTIADLIVADAERAETMTLRLAKVFRHVLAHSTRPVVTVREEMEFLRTYLHIEEARFGERLQVNFAVEAEVNVQQIPSLILQPLVENALKHGLSQQLGPGHLWITARRDEGRLLISIEDDGAGLPQGFESTNRPPASLGVGLDNVRRRLETLYQGEAGLVLEPRQPDGTRALIFLPLFAEGVK